MVSFELNLEIIRVQKKGEEFELKGVFILST